ncbi:MAG: dockerin type I domain-containing protein [Lactobacillus johnsonii]|nr:dockerin type I domain-containing protein [Lactobacillus johnsonii]
MLRKISTIRRKTTIIFLIFLMIFSITFVGKINSVNADSYRFTYNGNNLDTSKYPGYKNLIDTLKGKHSSWNFTIMETGLDFGQVILAETGNKSLIQGKSGSWVSGSFDSSWDVASQSTVMYYMDPRNWIQDNSSLFQFMALGTYVDVSDDELYNAVSGTPYLHDMSIVSQINKACRENSMNPFYVIARIMQEQGSTKPSSTFAMNDGGVTYYNIFNIGASGKGSQQVIANALQTAKNNGWTSVSACISGGIDRLKTYINRRQDTLYLNKFDVESYYGLYAYQYMQNIMAPQTEAGKMYNLMKNAGLLDKNFTFVIPVYTGMKPTKYLSPDVVGDLGPIDIQIKAGHNNINIRESPSTSATKKTKVNGGVKMLSIKRDIDGWHEIMYNNGNGYEIGYIKFNPEYLEQIADQTNCSETMVIGDDNVTLYAGPGKEEIKTLTRGQTVTRIDNSGNYTINNVVWDRISLADGTQGFVNRENLLNSSEVQLMYVNTESDPLTIRDAPNGNKIRKLAKGTQVTRISAANDMVAGHYWDEIVTPDGAIGYAAREYLAFVNANSSSEENNISKDDTNKIIKMEPNVTVSGLKSKLNDGSITIKDQNGNVLTDGNIGTGYVITINNQNYVAVKLGDSNGDGDINAGDLLNIRRKILGKTKLENEYKTSSDANSDGEINAGDLLYIRRFILNLSTINL